MITNKIIKKHINFDYDLKKFSNSLFDNINDTNILVIGGAGTIGSSYIKQILKFKPSKITVVDINENGLTELTRDLRSSNLMDHNPEYITYPVNLLSDTFVCYGFHGLLARAGSKMCVIALSIGRNKKQ